MFSKVENFEIFTRKNNKLIIETEINDIFKQIKLINEKQQSDNIKNTAELVFQNLLVENTNLFYLFFTDSKFNNKEKEDILINFSNSFITKNHKSFNNSNFIHFELFFLKLNLLCDFTFSAKIVFFAVYFKLLSFFDFDFEKVIDKIPGFRNYVSNQLNFIIDGSLLTSKNNSQKHENIIFSKSIEQNSSKVKIKQLKLEIDDDYKEFRQILEKIKNQPEIKEFINSSEIGTVILNEQKNVC